MTPDDFREIVLALDGAAEGAHMNHPDFRANGRIFATISPDAARGMVKLAPEQQEEFIRNDPDTFEPASGAWGRQGCTMVRLSKADEAIVGEAMTLAWQAVVAMKPAARKTRAARPAADTRRKKGVPR
jgi:hypothetical protein